MSGKDNPMYGKKGKNQLTGLDWSKVPFDKLGFHKRKERLLEKAGHKCSQCGYSKTRDCGATILEIDHIDGDANNNSENNLRVLCPNCHALTPTFRNWGGRVSSRREIRRKSINGHAAVL